MWSLVFRLALLASTLVVAWNFARAWIGVLTAPRKAPQISSENHAEIAARVMAEEATRHVTAIELSIAGLADEDLWRATAEFTAAVGRLKFAMLAEPGYYKRAKRHLSQILIGAEQVAKHFARHYSATPDPGTRKQYLALAGELAEAYDRATLQYASAGAADLEIEAETLKELLRRNRL